MVLVSIAGLVVNKDNVQFENIDFLWDHAAEVDSTKGEPRAVVQLRAGRATFRGCSFRCGPDREPLAPGYSASCAVSAVRWVYPGQSDEAETSLPSGRIELADCLLYRVDAGIDCRTIGAMGIELTNTLCLGAGPLLRLDHCPQADEAVSLSISQVTLRGGGPLLECRMPRARRSAGRDCDSGDRLCAGARAGRAAGAIQRNRHARGPAGQLALERARLFGDAWRGDRHVARGGRPKSDHR